MDWEKIEEISNTLLDEMGGNAFESYIGNCATFAKRMINRMIDRNIGNLKRDELEGYGTINMDFDTGIFHCYILVDGWYFDAFNPYIRKKTC